MPKPISTKLHGALDYSSALLLLALPRLMGWDERVTRLLTGSALATLAYSLLTRYELGLIKVLPMQAHLALDGTSGGLLATAPLRMQDEDQTVKAVLLGLGLFELTVTFLSQTETPDEAASLEA